MCCNPIINAQIERVKISISIINVIEKYIEFSELQLCDTKELKRIDAQLLIAGG